MRQGECDAGHRLAIGASEGQPGYEGGGACDACGAGCAVRELWSCRPCQVDFCFGCYGRRD